MESRQSGDVEEVEEEVVEPQGGKLGRWAKDAASGEESPRENVWQHLGGGGGVLCSGAVISLSDELGVWRRCAGEV